MRRAILPPFSNLHRCQAYQLNIKNLSNSAFFQAFEKKSSRAAGELIYGHFKNPTKPFAMKQHKSILIYLSFTAIQPDTILEHKLYSQTFSFKQQIYFRGRTSSKYLENLYLSLPIRRKNTP